MMAGQTSSGYDHSYCNDDLDPQLPYLGPFASPGARVLLQPQGTSWLAYWSANTSPDLLEALALAFHSTGLHNAVCQIEYLPPGFELDFLAAGWRPAGEYVEAWIDDLQVLKPIPPFRHPVRAMLSNEVMVAARITSSCREQTRGRAQVSPQWIERWAADPNQKVFLALDGSRPVGVIFARLGSFDHPRGTTCMIQDMVVMPGFQHRGLGRELLMSALYWGIQHNASRAYLAVDIQNQRAIQIYLAAGFQLKAGRGQINMQCDLP